MNNFEQQVNFFDSKTIKNLSQKPIVEPTGGTNENFDLISIAVAGIKHSALANLVQSAQQEYMQPTGQPTIIIKPLWTLQLRRLAAVVFVLLGSSAVYFAFQVDKNYLLQSQNQQFVLPKYRAITPAAFTVIEQNYANKNYKYLISQYNTGNLKVPSEQFLAGMSFYNSKQFAIASGIFEKLNKSTDASFLYKEELLHYQILSQIHLGNFATAEALMAANAHNTHNNYAIDYNLKNRLSLKLMQLKQ
jgi:hypothetical protein